MQMIRNTLFLLCSFIIFMYVKENSTMEVSGNGWQGNQWKYGKPTFNKLFFFSTARTLRDAGQSDRGRITTRSSSSSSTKCASSSEKQKKHLNHHHCSYLFIDLMLDITINLIHVHLWEGPALIMIWKGADLWVHLFPPRGRLILCDTYDVSIFGVQLSNGGHTIHSSRNQNQHRSIVPTSRRGLGVMTSAIPFAALHFSKNASFE